MKSNDKKRPQSGSKAGAGMAPGQGEDGLEGSLQSSISSDAARGPGLSQSAAGPAAATAARRGAKKAKPSGKQRTPGAEPTRARVAGTTLDRRDEARIAREKDPSMEGERTFTTSRSVDPQDEELVKAGSQLPQGAGSAAAPHVRPSVPGLPRFD